MYINDTVSRRRRSLMSLLYRKQKIRKWTNPLEFATKYYDFATNVEVLVEVEVEAEKEVHTPQGYASLVRIFCGFYSFFLSFRVEIYVFFFYKRTVLNSVQR